jgi:hypothetical protein
MHQGSCAESCAQLGLIALGVALAGGVAASGGLIASRVAGGLPFAGAKDGSKQSSRDTASVTVRRWTSA